MLIDIHTMKHNFYLYGFLMLAQTACSKKSDSGGSTNPGAAPAASIADVTQSRGTASSVFRFYIDLAAATPAKASIDFTTVAGTALAGKDFTAVSGTVNIDAGQTSGWVDVAVT